MAQGAGHLLVVVDYSSETAHFDYHNLDLEMLRYLRDALHTQLTALIVQEQGRLVDHAGITEAAESGRSGPGGEAGPDARVEAGWRRAPDVPHHDRGTAQRLRLEEVTCGC